MKRMAKEASEDNDEEEDFDDDWEVFYTLYRTDITIKFNSIFKTFIGDSIFLEPFIPSNIINP